MKESEDMRMDPRHSKAWYRGWHSFSMIKTCFTPVLTVWLLITKQYKTIQNMGFCSPMAV